jgi:competence protein ComEC
MNLWREAPFARLLVCLVAGIVGQWSLGLPVVMVAGVMGCCLLGVIGYFFLPAGRQFRWSMVMGAMVQLMVVCCGALLLWKNDVREREDWFGRNYEPSLGIMATLEEPLAEKANSYKALARVDAVCRGDSAWKRSGSIILYFRKDSSVRQLGYGSRILFRRPLREVRSAGNPGSFDYRSYCLLKGITHQVFLDTDDFVLLQGRNTSAVGTMIHESRSLVIEGLKKYIPGKKEQGLAEALLIGYKDDLDKDLVQAYADTGVVHVIAISGLHLGLIYWMLLRLTVPLRRMRWLRATLIIASLWMFSLMAGAQPSVLRSAVMFTCMAAGEAFSRSGSIYNTLALSAFALLCHNPYWLWDAGFQLSYSAVLSIVLFFRPIYNWFCFDNKLLDAVWKLNAVTLSAQLLTLPVSVYHFHRFPLLFLFTNLVAVPLSSLILAGEILLCTLLWCPAPARMIGGLLHHAIRLMNGYVERLDRVSFAVWEGLSISLPQALLATVIILALGYWLMERSKAPLWLGLSCLLAFTVLRSISFYQTQRQQKLVVYNIPRHRALELFHGRSGIFIGDTGILKKPALYSFHLQPSHILHRISRHNPAPRLRRFQFCGLNILLADSSLRPSPLNHQPVIDLLIVSGKSPPSIKALSSSFSIRQAILDASVPPWQSRRLQSQCDSLRIPCHNVAEKGAYEWELRN